jgi:predicted GNAT superfamily acetyltransferase
MSDESEITIRPAATIADYHACQEAQRRAWGITEEDYVVPIATMVGAQLHGGLVLGAFRGDGKAVGVSFAFLGLIEGRLGLYSQLTGVIPGQQGHGIGSRLKQAQWQFARTAGLELLAWAFDPLQAGNAHFNLGRLGARSHTYVENMYGNRSDTLNAGVPTDRLIVVWSTTEAPLARAAIGPAELERLPCVVEALSRPDGALGVVAKDAATEVAGGQDHARLEVPAEIGRLRAEAPELAERWRQAAATGFTTLFALGFEAVDFVRTSTGRGSRGFYVLHRRIPGR